MGGSWALALSDPWKHHVVVPSMPARVGRPSVRYRLPEKISAPSVSVQHSLQEIQAPLQVRLVCGWALGQATFFVGSKGWSGAQGTMPLSWFGGSRGCARRLAASDRPQCR